jgi:hypothetical protein
LLIVKHRKNYDEINTFKLVGAEVVLSYNFYNLNESTRRRWINGNTGKETNHRKIRDLAN